jgi:hypothetical protein
MFRLLHFGAMSDEWSSGDDVDANGDKSLME